ncbi:MAG: HEAT repeat domain-containing protein [Oscillospiraceae bacterium]|nr:HEAT repeat domain-containing protein [Oscillospiraceae bacterium]
MDKETALNFLKHHQPMPNDDLLDKKTIFMYDEVRKYFLNNPDDECLPLLLNSFGEYNGFGVYQLVEDVILKFDHKKVVNCLLEALKSHHKGVKYWCIQICASFPDTRLIFSLNDLLNDPNEDIRISVITALSQIQDEKVILLLKDNLKNENNETVKSFLLEVLDDVESDAR